MKRALAVWHLAVAVLSAVLAAVLALGIMLDAHAANPHPGTATTREVDQIRHSLERIEDKLDRALQDR